MRRALAVGALAGAVLIACGGPGEEEQLSDKLTSDYGLQREQADCVADQLYERFDAEEIDAFRAAETRDDLPPELLGDLRAALTPCASAGS